MQLLWSEVTAAEGYNDEDGEGLAAAAAAAVFEGDGCNAVVEKKKEKELLPGLVMAGYRHGSRRRLLHCAGPATTPPKRRCVGLAR